MSKWVLLLGLIVVVLGGGAWYLNHESAPVARFRTAPVARGDLLATISSTGTLEPEEVVDVGAQVDGQIVAFGPDPKQAGGTIDYGSSVDAGTVLAKIDDRLYKFDLENAQAQVEAGRSAVTKAEADLQQMKAKMVQATNDWRRAQQVGTKAGISQSEMDQYEANYAVARANVADQDAAIAQAKTAQDQYRAALDKAQQNVGYCTITSPVKGTIIDRRMNAGQTVVSAMSAPSLFLIAKDLRRMQVWSSVNEADIGRVHAGQPVTFTVDAFPGERFHGTVNKVRYNASMTQNVVTYTVEINTANDDGKLLPYLTANVQFELERRTNVLTVPNAALRWVPQDDEVAPDAAAADATAPPLPRASTGSGLPKTDGGSGKGPADGGAAEAHDRGTVWVADANGTYVRPVRVHVGVSDGTSTEVDAGDHDQLHDGATVVLGELEPGEAGGGTATNPFIPQFGAKKKK